MQRAAGWKVAGEVENADGMRLPSGSAYGSAEPFMVVTPVSKPPIADMRGKGGHLLIHRSHYKQFSN